MTAALACGSCGIFGSSDGKRASGIGPSVGATGGQSTGGSTAGGTGGQPGGSGGGGGSGATGASGCQGLPGPAMVEVAAPNGIKFCVDRTEVTQAQYADFVATATTSPGSEHALCKGINESYKPTTTGGGPDWEPTPCVESKVWTPATTPNRPAVCIDWCDAYAYCKWAGKRLCGKIGGGPGVFTTGGDNPAPDDPAIDADQSQWYSVCSQGGKTKYPYGDAYDPQACEGLDATKAPDGGELPKHEVGTLAGCRGSSAPYSSILDMSGSVKEFTDECKPLGASALCGTRGGSYLDDAVDLSCKAFGGFEPVRASDLVGFRCCKDVP